MKLIDKETWNAWIENNTDPYGKACVDYAKDWAELMEKRINNDEKLEDIAEQTSHDADTSGITGFMYGAAVSMLSQCWEYGEALRKWHNLNIQIGDEGKKANKEGGTLNPALLNIST